MNKKTFGLLAIAGVVLLDVCCSTAFAGEASGGVATIAKNVSNQLEAVSKLLVYVAYVAGVGFALAGILQFKAHKDNPTSTPLSKPVALIVVAACLLFLPSIMAAAGGTVFGAAASGGGVTFSGTVTGQ